MHQTAFDTLARHAGAVQDRRASLKALGAAAMVAAFAAPRAADAGKSSKKSKNSKKLCKKQVAACKNEWENACQGDETCLSLATCCSFLKNCDAAGQIKCITDIL